MESDRVVVVGEHCIDVRRVNATIKAPNAGPGYQVLDCAVSGEIGAEELSWTIFTGSDASAVVRRICALAVGIAVERAGALLESPLSFLNGSEHKSWPR